MAARASWKGHLKIGDIGCAVALYTAVSTSEKLSFNILNKKTGNRVERQFVDSETGKPVDREDQVKGYEIEGGRHIVLEPDEIADLMPESDKLLTVSSFIECNDIDKLYFDRPYYLALVESEDAEALRLLARAMTDENVAAIAEGVLFRRNRTLLIRPDGHGAIIATTLNFDYEVRSAGTTFKNIPEIKFEKEMLTLAQHIISTKSGSFKPEDYHDRYDAALVELVKAKMEGRKPPKRNAEPKGKIIDLMDALRESARMAGKSGGKRKATPARKSATKQRKAS
ncbi:Ku protein [Neorhizobium sp. NCHU2750]|uniref:non-homologous end joining protein Ku n=1 Tax=Neorhizobium sp. NCHU2750 TaxID=1825976 RepID=UPI000E727285|nr:DNA repair protein [Neorhizobium sp. NCHU2750]